MAHKPYPWKRPWLRRPAKWRTDLDPGPSHVCSRWRCPLGAMIWVHVGAPKLRWPVDHTSCEPCIVLFCYRCDALPIYIELSPDLLPARLHSSVGRALHRYRGGHGFESRWSLRIFLGFICNCLSYFTTAKISFTSIFYYFLVFCLNHSSWCLKTNNNKLRAAMIHGWPMENSSRVNNGGGVSFLSLGGSQIAR